MPATFNFEQLTVDNTTAQSPSPGLVSAGGKKAQKVILTIGQQNARMKINAAPTASAGIVLLVDGMYEFTAYDIISNMQFISEGAGNTIINLQYILI